ncbi:hypothetical protein AB0L59_20685 [Streptomyces sp. NPDC052109]|uniref:hypothetical protein n=1 Tax=Streptomyces sp. NPDC052109 TaxID=3155527 RepID=UPI0034438618
MIVGLIIACEVAFWVLPAPGPAVRHLLERRRASAALLLCQPLLELVLLVVTATDLRNGAAPDWRHGLAAVSIGFTAGFGHSTLIWADARVAHRFAGGPRPAKPPGYGTARAAHGWKVAGRWILACAVALALLQGVAWYVGGGRDTDPLRAWQPRLLVVLAVNVVVAVSYTLLPRREPAGRAAHRVSGRRP